LDRKSFAGPGLAIGKDGAVVAVKTLVYYRSTDFIKNLLLTGFFARHIVKGELFFGSVHAERACHYFLNTSSGCGVMLLDLLSGG
jgi:hypothetical protein